MAIFEEVVLKWRDQEYKIPPRRVLECIAAVEVTGLALQDLVTDADSARVPIGRLSRALGAALRFAGAQVTDDEIYDGLFNDPATLQTQALAAVVTLQLLMIPPARMREAQERMRAKGSAEGKPEAGPVA